MAEWLGWLSSESEGLWAMVDHSFQSEYELISSFIPSIKDITFVLSVVQTITAHTVSMPSSLSSLNLEWYLHYSSEGEGQEHVVDGGYALVFTQHHFLGLRELHISRFSLSLGQRAQHSLKADLDSISNCKHPVQVILVQLTELV